jgi:aryl-alcohol dehydrogenase-like predicted oxidoreductase
MEQRSLGRGGPRVGALGFGAMSFAGYYGTAEDAEGVRAINRALDLGITLIDTAESYGEGAYEVLVGRAFAGRRD